MRGPFTASSGTRPLPQSEVPGGLSPTSPAEAVSRCRGSIPARNFPRRREATIPTARWSKRRNEMSRAILGGAMLAALGTGLFAGYAFTARSQVSERELRDLQADMQSAHDRLARQVDLLRDAVEARDRMASPAPWSGDAVRVPDPAAVRSTDRERDDERRSSRPPEDLVNAFPTLVGDAKADAIEELVELARQQDAKALDLIVASLGDEDAEVREEAVEAIGELADPDRKSTRL